MMQDAMLTLTSCKYCDLASYSKVIDINQLDYYLWVYLDPDCTRNAQFIKGHELIDNPKDIIFPDTFVRPSTSWIRVKTDNINKNPGLHIYKFMFVDRYTDDVFFLYMSYIIHRTDVEKPYVYMKRDNS